MAVRIADSAPPRKAGDVARRPWLLLLPAVVVFTVLLVLPLLNVLNESFRLFIPGRVGAAEDAPFTLDNYRELFSAAYLLYFYDTFRISLEAALAALILGFPTAYYLARMRSDRLRKLWIGFLVVMLFLSVLVRVYAIVLAFGPVGFLQEIALITGMASNGSAMAEFLVVLGLLHYLLPISALTLFGTIQNVNPRLVDAAQSLGAARCTSHLTITIPLSVHGLLSAFLICYTLSLSAFIVPMILGKGRVLFISNIIYARFGEVANYPSGSALSIIMLLLTLVFIYTVSRVAMARWEVK